MKKRLLILLTVSVLLLCLSIEAWASNAGVATAEDVTVAYGGTATITISVNGCDLVKTGSIALTLDESVTVQSASWLLSSTTMANYNASTKKGVFTFGSDTAISGDVFKLTVKVADNAVLGAHEVNYTFQFRNNAGESFSTSGTAKLIVTCPHKNTENRAEQPATCKDVGYTAGVYCKDCETYISGHEEITKSTEHSYGLWTSVSDKKHSRTCSVCGNVETQSHVFDQKTATEGFLASPATCTKAATYYYSCVCGEKGTSTFESGDPLPHTYDQEVVDEKYLVSAATCVKKATYYKSCSCGAAGTETFETGDYADHSYGTTTYQWNGDKCTAERVCAHDANHKETETVTGIYVKDTDATCTENEKGHYEATFTNTYFAKQATEKDSIEKENTKLGHAYGTATYEWNGDKCTAERVCTHDGSHKETETVTGIYVKDTDATCEENEKGHYEATFTNTYFAKQATEKDSIEKENTKLGHSYGTATYKWNGNQCTAERVCTRDSKHVETETVTGTFVTDTNATCTANAKGHYEATFTNTAFAKQSTETNGTEKADSALGHAYGTATYEWDGDKCTAERVCTHDGSHKETETVTGTYVKDTDATCEENEKGHYEATFTNTYFAKQATEKDSIEKENTKLGHSYGTATYKWDGDKCTAERVCTHDGSHKETETVTGIYVKDTDATCTENEKGHYEATFTNAAFAKQTTAKDSVAKDNTKLGHSYATPTYKWDGDKCTATRVCTNNGEHIETETVTGIYVKDTDATCTENEKGHYEATFTNTYFAKQTTEKNSVAKDNTKLGHDFTVIQTSETEHWHKCSRCDETDTPVAHTYNQTNTDLIYLATEANCTEKATYYYSCECGVAHDTDTFESGNALGHSFTNYNYNDDATCMADGTETAKCDRCTVEDTRTKSGTKKAHTFINYTSNNDATCTKDGTETGTCSAGCGTTDTRTVTGSKLGHLFENYQYNDDATCTKDGTETSKCSRCDVTDTRTKAGTKLPHDFDSVWHSDAEGHFHVCKNCPAKGEVIPHTPGAEATEDTPQVCTVCGYIITPALGHRHSLTKVPATSATCTESGNTEYYVCSGCSDWFSDSEGNNLISNHNSVIVQAYGHSIVKDALVPATCTKNGKTAGSHCRICGEVIEAQRVIHATGHTEVDDPAIEATCQAEGKTAGKHCTVCGAVTVAQNTVPKLDHTVVTDPAKQPTCTESGLTEGSHCSVCGEAIKAQENVPATGHHYGNAEYDENGHWQTCEICSEKTGIQAHTFTVTYEDGKIVYTCECGYSKSQAVEADKPTVIAGGNEDGTDSGTVTLSDTLLDQVLDNTDQGVIIELGGGMAVEYDKSALAAIASAIGGKDVTLNVGETTADDANLNDSQKQTLENAPDGSSLFSITLECDGVTIHSFDGGKATITMPFELPETWNPGEVTVYRVEEDGTKTPMKTEFKNGTVTWETDGHSFYLVTKATETKDDDTLFGILPATISLFGIEFSTLITIIAVAVILIVAIVVVVFVIIKKKKHK